MKRAYFFLMILFTHLTSTYITADELELVNLAEDIEDVDGFFVESDDLEDESLDIVRRKSKRKKCCCSSLRVRCNAAIGGNLAVSRNVAVAGNEAVAGNLAVGESLSVQGRPVLPLLAGAVSGAGTLARGVGFTVTPVAAGTFNVLFTQPFNSVPVVVVSPESTLAFSVSITNVSPAGFTILAPAIGAADLVDFIAVGL